jgi:hypothetical protein
MGRPRRDSTEQPRPFRSTGEKMVRLPCGISGINICCLTNCQQERNQGDMRDPDNMIERCYHSAFWQVK